MKIGLEVVLCMLGAVVLVLVLWNVHFQWRLRKHRGMSRASFITYFVEHGFKAEIAAAVFDYYRSKAIWRTFGISPEDKIAVLFNQEGDDTDDDLLRMLKKFGLVMPADEAWDARGEPPIRTAETWSEP